MHAIHNRVPSVSILIFLKNNFEKPTSGIRNIYLSVAITNSSVFTKIKIKEELKARGKYIKQDSNNISQKF